MSDRFEGPLDFFWQCLRQDRNRRLDHYLSHVLAAEFNVHACSKCGRKPKEEMVAVAPCLNCERWICYRCHNPALPFGSISDFNYFVIDTGRVDELSCAGAKLWPILCPYCRTEVPRPEVVVPHLLPEEFRPR
jgi:hypothetical protein